MPRHFGLLDLQLMKIAHISCIFSIKFAVFTEYGKTSIQTKGSPFIFVQQLSFLSEKIFQSVGQLSGNVSEDFAKTGTLVLSTLALSVTAMQTKQCFETMFS